MENRTLLGKEDGLVMNEDVGSWTPEKYRQIQLYMHQFTTGMKDKWRGKLTFVDLFAGTGLSRLKQTGEILLGSPLIALSMDQRFAKYIFCDEDTNKISVLKQRVSHLHAEADVQYFVGNCNDPKTDIDSLIPLNSLTLCFVDPYDMSVRLETLKRLSSHNRRVDFLCLIASGTDAARNIHNYTKEESLKLDQCLGDSDWRKDWERVWNASGKRPNLGEFVRDQLSKRMETIGYLKTDPYEMRPIKNDGNVLLYHLALYTKNELGKKFWNNASKHSTAQRTLDFD